jgi:Uma2 family endonuclease
MARRCDVATITYPSGVTAPVPPLPVRKFTVDEYHQLLAAGTLKSGDPYELLEGWIVQKMSRNTPHETCLVLAADAIRELIPVGFHVRVQSAITMSDSEPEPDVIVVRGGPRDFPVNLPSPPNVALVVEIADSSLQHDRVVKGRIYARAGIPVFWVVNLVDMQIEIYTVPTGDVPTPEYRQRVDFRPGQSAPLVVAGAPVGNIAVDEILP